MNRIVLGLVSLVSALGLVVSSPVATLSQAVGLGTINHVIVIYQENWSVDGLYGRFPGANGIANARATVRRVDTTGRPRHHTAAADGHHQEAAGRLIVGHLTEGG